VRGRLIPANEELAGKILNDLIRISAPFGTTIRPESGIGIVQVRQRGSRQIIVLDRSGNVV
jgi:hypothetical protein